MATPDDKMPSKVAQLTVSTKELGSKSSHSSLGEGRLGSSFDGYGHLTPTTPTSANTVTGFDVDMEGMKHTESSEHLREASMNGNRLHSDSSVWPGQAHWREKALAAERKNRSCQCLARLSKRTRITVKVAILLFIVGVAVGVGFGISKSLGARVWQPKDDQR
ncbi:hypothetical protein O1611_g4109 [Lasiodiplodia mahajangana]|uniref:Uncharacterized protein n=1 Tax=Lasiodiplodia mahajangana TaxID=1108764 RepID=A0ACC2JPX6_9PEZI|nr:hypothetical protein O1611_g4109 [Lasiodiplodia mahajangana]